MPSKDKQMPSVSQLTREWCRKCKEETLHVCAHCNHCGTEHVVYKGPAFEHARIYTTRRQEVRRGKNLVTRNEEAAASTGTYISGGKNLYFGGVSDDMWQG